MLFDVAEGRQDLWAFAPDDRLLYYQRQALQLPQVTAKGKKWG